MTRLSHHWKMSVPALVMVGFIVCGLPQPRSGGEASAGEPIGPSAVEQQGLTLINARCTLCHSSDLISQQRLDRQSWTKVVDKMVTWGAAVGPDERKFLLDYLSASYGPPNSTDAPPTSSERRPEPRP